MPPPLTSHDARHHTMPSKPCRPHFLPATWQPNRSASCMLCPGGRGTGRGISQAVGERGSVWGGTQGRAPASASCRGLTSGQAEDDGGVEGVASAQRVHHAGRREGLGVEQLSVGAQGVGPLLGPGAHQRRPAGRALRLAGWEPPLGSPPLAHPLSPGQTPSPGPPTSHTPTPPFLGAPAHPFLTRLYRPLRASAADWNPKCLATSLLTNTCGQRETITLTLVPAQFLPPAAAHGPESAPPTWPPQPHNSMSLPRGNTLSCLLTVCQDPACESGTHPGLSVLRARSFLPIETPKRAWSAILG